MKIIQSTLQIKEKFSAVPKPFREGPKKVGSVGFPETTHFFWPLSKYLSDQRFLWVSITSQTNVPSFWKYAVELVSEQVQLFICECAKFWAAAWQNQQNVPSEDSDQPGHLPNLITVFTVRMKKAWVLNYPLSAQLRLWSGWVMLRLIRVFAKRNAILLVLSWDGSNNKTAWNII